MVADLAFDLEYDGTALAEHEMDVRDLAPALLSTSLMLQELNRQVFPNEPDLTVNVRATSEGSCRQHVYDGLVAAMKHRRTVEKWVEHERLCVAVAANQWATANPPARTVTVDDVERIEQQAVGHVDYASKLALYVAEFVMALRQPCC